MPKLTIIDDLMAPSDTIKVKFKGEKPASILGMIPELIRNTMAISSKDILETDLRWDALGDSNGFYGVWMGKRAEDRWSTTRIRVIVQGEQNIKEKTGNFEMQLKGTSETTYEYSNFIQRGFWMFYNRHFYNDHRRKLIDEGKGNIIDIREEIMSRFKISQEEF